MSLLDVYMYILYLLTAAFIGWILYAAYTECTGAGPAGAGDYGKEFRMSEMGSPSTPTSTGLDVMEDPEASDTPAFSPTFKD